MGHSSRGVENVKPSFIPATACYDIYYTKMQRPPLHSTGAVNDSGLLAILE